MRTGPGRRPRFSLAATAAAGVLVALLATPDPDLPPGRRPAAETARSLAAALGAPTARERDEAAAALAALGPDALAALRDAARSEDPEIRARARALLARVDGPTVRARRLPAPESGAVPPIGEPRAASHEGRDDTAGTNDALVRLAVRASERAFVEGTLARALVRRPTAESLAALAAAWRNDRLVPSAGLDAARALDAAHAAPDAAAALRRTATPAAAALGDVLSAPEGPRRRAGVALLASFAAADAAETLVRAASDPDSGVRREAARVLARHLRGDGAAALRRLAADRDPTVRVAALEALRGVPGLPRPGPAVAASRDEVPAVRRAAAELLAREATAEELPVLRALEEDPSLMVRAAARRSLVALGASGRNAASGRD